MNICKNCGTEYDGEQCPVCGEVAFQENNPNEEVLSSDGNVETDSGEMTKATVCNEEKNEAANIDGSKKDKIYKVLFAWSRRIPAVAFAVFTILTLIFFGANAASVNNGLTRERLGTLYEMMGSHSYGDEIKIRGGAAVMMVISLASVANAVLATVIQLDKRWEFKSVDLFETRISLFAITCSTGGILMLIDFICICAGISKLNGLSGVSVGAAYVLLIVFILIFGLLITACFVTRLIITKKITPAFAENEREQIDKCAADRADKRDKIKTLQSEKEQLRRELDLQITQTDIARQQLAQAQAENQTLQAQIEAIHTGQTASAAQDGLVKAATITPPAAGQTARAANTAGVRRNGGITNENLPSEFTGGAFANYFANLLVGFVSIITLSLAFPAMYCWKQRWYARHTFINGRQLKFDGKGGQLFGRFLLWSFLSLITFGIFFIVSGKISFIRWQTKHTHFAGCIYESEEQSRSEFDGKWYQLFGVNFVANLVTVITLSFGYYWAYCYKQRWLCKHKTIDGCALQFDGKAGQYFGRRLLWSFLTIITIGIYSFWYLVNLKKWLISHTRLQDPSKAPAPFTIQETQKATNGLSIAGFVLSFFGTLSVVGLILSAVGLVKSKKINSGKGLAIAGIVISSLVILSFAIFYLYIFGVIRF